MKKGFIVLLVIWIIALVSTVGLLSKQEEQSRNVKIEIQYAGIFGVTVNEYGATYSWEKIGLFEYQIYGYSENHREASLYAQKLEGNRSPLFIFVKNPDDRIMYSEVNSEPYGDISLNVQNTCNICHESMKKLKNKP